MRTHAIGMIVGLGLLGLLAFACGEDDGGGQANPCASAAPTSCTCDNGQSGTLQCVNGSATGCSCQSPAAAGDAGSGTTAGATTSGGGSTGAGTPGGATPGAGTPGAGTPGGATPGGIVDAGATGGAGTPGGTAGGAAGGTAGGGMMGGPGPATGPKDGDPSKPVVTAEGVACRASSGGTGGGGVIGGLAGGLGSANAMVGGRELIVDYPCGKHEGAHMTVILNLHGTLIGGAPWQYQRGYFAAYKLVDSHNLIVVHPRSVSMASAGAQWGNMDGGQDLPHLLAVIDWVYKTFSKYQLTSLWIAGHSWGSMYAKTFVCNDTFKDKAKGVIGMSGGATGVGGSSFGGGIGGAAGMGAMGCAARVSQIHTVGDQETGGTAGVPDQTAVAMAHGCGAKMGPTDLGNMQMLTAWPNCSPGWTHFNVVMGAHQHTTSINPEVVKYIIDQVKSTEN